MLVLELDSKVTVARKRLEKKVLLHFLLFQGNAYKKNGVRIVCLSDKTIILMQQKSFKGPCVRNWVGVKIQSFGA